MSELTDYFGIDPRGFRLPEKIVYPLIDLINQMIAKGAFATVGGPGVTDHGLLTGLADDDHPQYLNNARGDARYALIAHTQAISSITGLQAALDAKLAASLVSAYGLTLIIAADSAAARTVLGLGTAAVTDSSDYALAVHTHTIAQVSGLQAALDAKAALSHTHTASEITDFTSAVLALIPASTTYTADEATLHLASTVFSIKALGVGTAQLAAAGVTYAKIQNLSATDLILGRSSSGGGTVEEIPFTAGARTFAALADLAAQKSYLNLSGTNTGDQDLSSYATISATAAAIAAAVAAKTITLTGDVTGSGTSSFAATLAASGATAGTYSNPTLTIDAKGRIVLAINGSGSAAVPVDFKDSVAVATTANITLSGEQTLDGVLTAGSRVLVWNQTNAAENGLYLSAAGAWSRTTDADASAEVTAGMLVLVESGTLYADQLFVLATGGTITLGTTLLTFQAVSVPAGVFVGKVVAGTTYTHILTDAQKRLILTNVAAKTVTVAPNSSVASAVNAEIEVFNDGLGTATIVAGVGVTINSNGLTLAQYSLGKLKKRANPNTWDFTSNGVTNTTINFGIALDMFNVPVLL